MADRTYRNRERQRSDRPRQAEQFQDEDLSWRGEERGYGQMEGWRDEDYGHDLGGQPYGRERSFARAEERIQPELYSERRGPYSTGHFGRAGYDNREGRGFRSFTGSDQGGRDFAGPRYNYGPGRGPYTPSGPYGAGSYGEGIYGAAPRREYGRGWDEDRERGWLERAGDEVASWFGDEDAARRREQDHRGLGPAGYTRSDERIREDVCDALTDDRRVDARDVEVTVTNGEVMLNGTVPSREQKRRAEDCVEDLSGVKNVQNNLRVDQGSAWDRNNSGATLRSRDAETTG